ncbi:Signal transduction histidine kinase [Chitinispirillum alkaliphilum]|nr:Signal transduction histidine kinase [Chitinispirillum alkaliphilum]
MDLRGEDGLILAQSIVETIGESLIVLDGTLHVVSANRAFYSQFEVSADETEGKLIYDLGNGQWNIPRLRHLLEEVITRNHTFEGYQIKHRFGEIGERALVFNGRRLKRLPGEPEYILLAIKDVTSETLAQKRFARSEEKYRKFVEGLNSIIIGVNNEGRITFFNSFSEKIFGYTRQEVMGEPFVGKIIPCIDSKGRDNSHFCRGMFSEPDKYYANENEGVRKDGLKIWFTWSAKAIYDEAGEVSEILIDGNDITELTKSRQELEEKSSQLDAIMEFIPEGIMISDKEHRIIAASSYMCKILNIDISLLCGTDENRRLKMLDVYWPDGQKLHNTNDLPLSKAVDTGTKFENYEMMLKSDGVTKILSVNAGPIRDEDGNVTGGISAWRDFTEHKKLLQQYNRQNQLLQTIIDSIPVMITIHDPESGNEKVNRAFEQITQWTNDDIVNGSMMEMLYPDPHYRAMAFRHMHSSLPGFKDLQMFGKNGDIIHSSWAYSKLADGRLVGVGVDIRERKAAENALRESEDRFSKVFRSSPVMLSFSTYDEGIFIEVNDTFCRLTGYSREELIGHSSAELGIISSEFRKTAKHRLETEERIYSEDTQINSRHGYKLDVIFSAEILNINGNRYILTSAIDVTQRKKAQKQLRESNEQLIRVLESIPDAFVSFDHKLRYTYVNNTAEKLQKIGRERLLGRNVREVYSDKESYKTIRHYENILKTRKPETFTSYHSGFDIWVEVRAFPTPDGISVFYRDVSERIKAEKALEESEFQFRQLAEVLPQLVWVTRPDGYHEYFNSRWYEFTGTKPGETSGELWANLLHPDDYQRTLEVWNNCLKTGTPYEIEYRFRRASDNTYHWFIGRAFPVRNEQGKITRWFGTSTYINDLKVVQQRLKEIEERYHLVNRATHDIIWDWNLLTNQFEWNEAIESVTKKNRNEMPATADSWYEHIHPLDKDRVLTSIHQSISRGQDFWSSEYRFGPIGGPYREFLDRGHIARDENGRAYRMIGSMLDLTERKHFEEALRANEQRYSALFNNKTFGIAHCKTIVNEQGKPVDYSVIQINEAYTELLGVEKKDVEGKRVTEVFPGIEEFYFDFIGNYGKVALEGGDMQFEVNFEYAKKWLYIYAYSPAHMEFVAIFTDITDRKQAEKELRNERELLQTILSTLPVGLFIAEPDGKILEVNPAGCDIWGGAVQKAETISEYSGFTGYHPDTGKQLKPQEWPLARAVQEGETVKGEIIDIRRLDGTPATILAIAAPIRDPEGRIIRAVEVNQDITGLKLAGQELRKSEEKFRAIFEQAGVGIGRVRFDDARWIDVNTAFCDMLGYSADELKATPWPEITHPEDIDLDLVPFKQMAAGDLESYSVEKRFIHKKGHHVWARLTLSLVNDEQGRPDYEIAIIEDITERKKAEAELKSRTGELAAANKDLEAFSYSVSHDLRNPLSVIGNFSEFVLEDYSDNLDAQGQDFLRRIADSVKKMQQLIDDMLSLSRIGRHKLERENVNLSLLVWEHLNELKELESHRKTEFLVQENVHAYADPRMIHVAIENLLRNAWKFTSKRSLTRIEFGMMQIEGKTVFYVKDNGVGFDMQFAQKIFEPFKRVHTEKEFSGTGVGLSIVQRVISRHGGNVWAEGEPDRGATFYFTLQ